MGLLDTVVERFAQNGPEWLVIGVLLLKDWWRDWVWQRLIRDDMQIKAKLAATLGTLIRRLERSEHAQHVEDEKAG